MLNGQSQRLGLSISIVQNIAADGHNVLDIPFTEEFLEPCLMMVLEVWL